jgi:hypothetical protein
MESKYSQNSSTFIHAKFEFNPEGYWKNPIDVSKHYVDYNNSNLLMLFDQNGYDLTELEKLYSIYNEDKYHNHRSHRFALKKPWYHQIPDAIEGPVINHCYLFERKGYTGAALRQLQTFAANNPLFHKVIAIRPKWGIDFSLDYVGRDGVVFEIFHYEYDCFSYLEAEKARKNVEIVIETTDWNAAAKELLNKKHEWENLSFFEQSDYKCKFFGLPSEQFKMVTWK